MRFLVCLGLCVAIPSTAPAKELKAAETQTSVVVVDDAQLPPVCGIHTVIRAVSSLATDLQTIVDVQVLTELTDDGQGVAGKFRVRVVRLDLHEGELRIVGAPRIVGAELRSGDGEAVIAVGPDATQSADGYVTSFVATDTVNALMVPFGERGASRRLSFQDAYATRGAESVDYELTLNEADVRAYMACVGAMIRRGEGMQ